VDPPADPPKPTGKPDFTDEQQLHVNDIVKRETKKAVDAALKSIADQQAEEVKKAEKEREAAARKLLKAQGDLQELNTQLEQENERLKADVDRMTSELADFHKDIESEYTAFRETMPPALAVFDVGESASPSAKRDFVAKGRKMIADLGTPFRPGAGQDPAPRASGAHPGGDPDDDLEFDARELILGNRRYNRF